MRNLCQTSRKDSRAYQKRCSRGGDLKTVIPEFSLYLFQAIEHAKSTSTPEAWKKNTLKFLLVTELSFENADVYFQKTGA